MKSLYKYFILSAFIITAFSCEENEYEDINPPTAISFELESQDLNLQSNADSYELRIHSTTTTNTDRTFSIGVLAENSDGTSTTDALDGSYSYGNQITIPAGELVGSTSVTFNIDALDFVDPQTVVFGFSESDFVANVTRENFVLTYQKECPLTLVTLDLTFDAYAEEAYWEIYDLSGTPTVILSGGQGEAYADLDNSSLSLQFCLDSGNYGVIVYDGYGDGGTAYSVSVGGVSLTSGTTPDAGGGYPVETQSVGTFTVN